MAVSAEYMAEELKRVASRKHRKAAALFQKLNSTRPNRSSASSSLMKPVDESSKVAEAPAWVFDLC